MGGLEQVQEVFLFDVLIDEGLELLGEVPDRCGTLLAFFRSLGSGTLQEHAHDAQHRGDHLRALLGPRGRAGDMARGLAQAVAEERRRELHAVCGRDDILRVGQHGEKGQGVRLHEVQAARDLLHDVRVEERGGHKLRQTLGHEVRRGLGLGACGCGGRGRFLGALEAPLEALGLALGVLARKPQEQVIGLDHVAHGDAPALGDGIQ
mmetsp:Transcript_94483/g.246569  ORF Transcript_94483/g.246569 Transcript_94483/m.246569 type:complete len:207 (+) Transcript_94483:1806-2426(+)